MRFKDSRNKMEKSADSMQEEGVIEISETSESQNDIKQVLPKLPD